MELLTNEEIIAAVNKSREARDAGQRLIKMSEEYTKDVRAIAQAQLDKCNEHLKEAYNAGVDFTYSHWGDEIEQALKGERERIIKIILA